MIVLHRSISIVFIILHFLLFVVCVVKVIDRGNFINETPACYITSPLIYMTYL